MAAIFRRLIFCDEFLSFFLVVRCNEDIHCSIHKNEQNIKIALTNTKRVNCFCGRCQLPMHLY